jgi:hypothetical protein
MLASEQTPWRRNAMGGANIIGVFAQEQTNRAPIRQKSVARGLFGRGRIYKELVSLLQVSAKRHFAPGLGAQPDPTRKYMGKVALISEAAGPRDRRK